MAADSVFNRAREIADNAAWQTQADERKTMKAIYALGLIHGVNPNELWFSSVFEAAPRDIVNELNPDESQYDSTI